MNVEIIAAEKLMSADEISALSEHIIEHSIRPPCEFTYAGSWTVRLSEAQQTQIVQYTLSTEEPEMLEMSGTTLFVSEHLPHADFSTLEFQLHFDKQLIRRILAFPLVSMTQTPESIERLSMHRMMLLCGPPGSGKTSVAIAAFENAAKRIPGVFITVNAHALFSKWFSESGKTVERLFTAVREFAEESPVYLLIDEVESLAASRTRQNEPGDAVRAANAVLTELDQMRSCQKLSIICTSNLAGELDSAFLDRCDCVFEIGPPGPEQRRRIIEDVITACVRTSADILDGSNEELIFDSAKRLEDSVGSQAADEAEETTSSGSVDVADLVSLTDGMSGRMLRKLPVLALLESFDAAQPDLSQLYPEPEQLLKLMKLVILSGAVKH